MGKGVLVHVNSASSLNSKQYFRKGRLLQLIAGILLFSPFFSISSASAREFLVENQKDYKRSLKQLVPGDAIVLKNGIWNDFEVLFSGKGKKGLPITLKPETKGKVILSGQSNIRLAGEYLHVTGLVFKNGYTPTQSVVMFRRNKQELAHYSRVSEIVIDNFNNPERTETDYWVTMYGKHNRFDHNHLEGKRNKGVTMAVRLNTKASQENYHRIDYNYFGPRPILGSNGGETLRIGTSHYSLTNSYTVVENNYFDRCDGELEIISNKSGGNTFRGNVFFESRGTLTMRHGNDNTVENNVFFGNGVDHTGGIRVINKRQTIRNNYLQGLTGYRLGGALVVMNGVPNSKINRYHQVDGAVIESNTLVDSDHIQFAAGSDAERTAAPINSYFRNNLIFNRSKKNNITIFDDVSGISFAGNVVNSEVPDQIASGFKNAKIRLQKSANGLLYSSSKKFSDVGIKRAIKPIKKHQTGVAWYPKSDKTPLFDTGKTIHVKPGQDTLTEALASADAGDILALSAGVYVMTKILEISQPVTIRAKRFSAKSPHKNEVRLRFERTALIDLLDGGSVRLYGLKITGEDSPDNVGNAVIRTSRYAMLINYEVRVEHCEVSDLDVNRSFNFMSVSKSTFANRIEIANSSFRNISGAILKLDAENDDYGIYNAEYVKVANSNFDHVAGSLVDFYRGGTDESTFGPHFDLAKSNLDKVGYGSKNKSRSSIYLHGVQVASIEGNVFRGSPAIKVEHTVGDPKTKIINNTFHNSVTPSITELVSKKENTAIIDGNHTTTGKTR